MKDQQKDMKKDEEDKDETGTGEWGPCMFCGTASPGCPECGLVSSCPAHLGLHRRGHTCFPWVAEEREGVGRVMVTTRPVRAGEVLFMEEPVVVGPSQTSSILCLSCYLPCTRAFTCPRCHFPMCDQRCAGREEHREECAVLARTEQPEWEAEGDTEAYHCLLPLRLLLLHRSRPEQAALTDRLMDHEEERRGSEDWTTTERTVVRRLCQAEPGFTVEEVRRALGVLEVNCYEVANRGGAGVRACYPVGSLLSHRCVANSRHQWLASPPYTNTCLATVDLEEGEEVVTSYQEPTMCSLRRRKELEAGWYFSCSCHRCSSPTELATHLNTLVCPSCHLPSLLPSNPSRQEEEWRCACHHTLPGTEAATLVTTLMGRISRLAREDRYNTPAWLALDEEVVGVVHPQHEARYEVAKWLVPILARAPGASTSSFPLEMVQRKVELAEVMVAVLEVVEPGYSKSRAKAVYEMVETKLHLAFTTSNSPKEELNSLLESSITYLEDVCDVFEKLGANKGFEEVMAAAASNLVVRCGLVVAGGEAGKQGWDLMALARWSQPTSTNIH